MSISFSEHLNAEILALEKAKCTPSDCRLHHLMLGLLSENYQQFAFGPTIVRATEILPYESME